MLFLSKGSWKDYVEDAVKALNEGRHSVWRYSLQYLWKGIDQMSKQAFDRAVILSSKRNQKRRVVPRNLYTGEFVLVWKIDTNLGRLLPKLCGPHILVRRVSDHLWEVKRFKRNARGQQPVLRLHLN